MEAGSIQMGIQTSGGLLYLNHYLLLLAGQLAAARLGIQREGSQQSARRAIQASSAALEGSAMRWGFHERQVGTPFELQES